jgi:hypothetical protein
LPERCAGRWLGHLAAIDDTDQRVAAAGWQMVFGACSIWSLMIGWALNGAK